MSVMLTKFKSKSNRVKGLAFHPSQPLLPVALHNGSIQLWNYRMGVLVDHFEEHEGPVRGVNFHLSRALLVTGGDDYKIKVQWCLFTLHAHLDYVRTVQFHHEMPWICFFRISTSDDQTIRIWNITSRNCIAILTGHSHYVMSALFHPKDDLVVSASMDQTVRVWDISGLRKGSPNPAGVLEGHDRGVNYAMFHPTLPLIISAADHRTIKIWRMSETNAWEVDSCRGHFNNVSTALFHPKHELIVSCGEDKTIRVCDLAKRTSFETFRRENDRFWVLASHPNLNLFAAGHDSGLLVFKLERERPAFVVHQDSLYYIRDKYVRSYDFNTGADLGLLSVRKFGSQYVPPRTLSFNPAERAVLVTISSDNGLYELTTLPQQAQSELKDSSVDGKKGAGRSGIFVARNRYAVLQKTTQLIEIRDLANTVVKTIKPPVQTNEIFYGGTASLMLSSATSVVLYDIQQQKTLAEINSPPVKYVVWSTDGALVALMSKHTITIANKNFSQHSLIHETIRIKSGPRDDSGVFIYSTLNHVKYCLSQGDHCVICTLDNPVYLTRVKGKTVHCLDRSARPRTITFDPTEYRFKLALLKNNYEEMLCIIRTSTLLGQIIIAYLQQKGFPEIALHFVQDTNTRFELAIECGNLDVAMETAKTIDRAECWERLAQQALKQGNHKIVEKAYQQTNNFDKLSLSKIQKIADARGDPMSRFHNALYAGDVLSRISVMRDVALWSLEDPAYPRSEEAKSVRRDLRHRGRTLINTNTEGGRKWAELKDAVRRFGAALAADEDVERLRVAYVRLGEDVENGLVEAGEEAETEVQAVLERAAPRPPVPSFGLSTLKPPPVVTATTDLNWPAASSGQNFFDRALANGSLEAGVEPAYFNGDAAAAAGASYALDAWARDAETHEEVDPEEGGWELDADGGEYEGAEPVDDAEEEAAVEADLPGSTPGVSEIEHWTRNSPLAVDHVSAGSFEMAMQLHIRRNPAETSLGRAFPVVIRSSASIRTELSEGFRFVSSNKVVEAQTVFRSVLRGLLLWRRDLVTAGREYLLGVCIELERRRVAEEEPDNVRQNLELAAYFTQCKMQPPHVQIALRSALSVFAKANNQADAVKLHLSYGV
ncbi:coatomer subunit alpha-2 [Mycena metata]|uniref:Coatomer subunit alpha n=1 Tax=Mycena metata TaxID=1033252 RepID=A0AAD7H5I5_9AGAR|nr:coatomer subunit alpha-2 [Mycena metata]